jgi:hypothetical protein
MPDSEESTGGDRRATDQVVRVTDKIGVLGLDGTEYPERGEHVTTVNGNILRDALEILDTLGWDQVDVIMVDGKGEPDYPMMVLRPPEGALFATAGPPAGIAITPLTEDGRNGDGDD